MVFLISLVVSSCKKEFDVVPDAPIVVKAYIYGNEPVTNVYIESVATSREFDTQLNNPIVDAEVKLKVNNDFEILLQPDESRDGFYVGLEEDTIYSNSSVVLEVSHNGRLITSKCFIPEGPLVTSTFGVDEVSVISMGSQQVLGSISWDTSSDYEHLLDLTLEEEEEIPLVFNGAQGRFDDFYSLPIKTNSADILADDFSFQGLHKLTIYSLSPEYSEYFNYVPTRFDRALYEAPNNINNGYGVFAGLTGTTLNIIIQE